MLRPKPFLATVRRRRNVESRYGSLRLDKNEHTVGLPSALVRDILAAITPERLATYPELGALYGRLAASLGIDREQLMVTAGSDAAIKAMYEVFVSPGDEVVLLEPTYAMFGVYAQIFGARVVPVRYRADLTIEIDDVIGALTRSTRLVAIANPNSPTGTAVAEKELVAIIEAAGRHDVPVLVDEAYFPFHPCTMVPSIHTYEHLAVTRTLSKASGLAALRVGYVAASRPMIELLMKVRPLYEVDGLAATIACAVLERPELAEEYVREIRAGGAWLESALRGLGLPTQPTATNFVLVRVEDERVRRRIVTVLQARRILIADALPAPLEAYLRITLGPTAQMTRVAEGIAAALGR